MIPEGPIAEDIARLWWVLLAIGTAVYLAVLVLLVLPALRRRGARAGPDEGAAHRSDRPDVPADVTRRWIVAGGVVLPAIVLPIVLALSVATMRDIPQEVPEGGLVIEVVGRQWSWSAHYPEHDVTATNEIHIPVGEPVELRLTSRDVIHSFWVPELAGKIDALPDGTNTLVVEAAHPGEYEARCAEFCGLHHAEMAVVVVAEPRARFEAWLADEAATGDE